MNRSDLGLGDVVYFHTRDAIPPRVERAEVASLGHLVHVRVPDAAAVAGHYWIEIHPAHLHPTRAAAWAALLEVADCAAVATMDRVAAIKAAAAADCDL